MGRIELVYFILIVINMLADVFKIKTKKHHDTKRQVKKISTTQAVL